jgi:hypothetical protein
LNLFDAAALYKLKNFKTIFATAQIEKYHTIAMAPKDRVKNPLSFSMQ